MRLIIPDKSYSNNPFVDNMLYYAKYMALNATVKDDDLAKKYETKESLALGNLYIACIEGRVSYEQLPYVPMEILEKYIVQASNLDILAKDPQWLKNALNSLNEPYRTQTLNRLSELARDVYISHYDIMTKYIYDVGITWIDDKLELYNKCVNGNATYMDLFDEIPIRAILRILRIYLNIHGYIALAQCWDPDSPRTKLDVAAFKLSNTNPDGSQTYDGTLLEYLKTLEHTDISKSYQYNQFIAYINYRDDTEINNELNKISQAMREVFMSHYNIMKERKYFSSLTNDGVIEVVDDNTGESTLIPYWYGFTYNKELYNKCINGSATWRELYSYFPMYALDDVLSEIFGSSNVESYALNRSVNGLQQYMDEYIENGQIKSQELTQKMTSIYIGNYRIYLNKSIYQDCKAKLLNIYDLYTYLPNETLKSILNTEFPETTNIQIFANDKNMLNSYLASIDSSTAEELRASFAKDMISYYPLHHIEKNNYYRSLIGLPPIDSMGNVLVDTLTHSYDNDSKSFIELGTTYIDMCPTNVYPISHWKNELYKFDIYDISVLKEHGILDKWISALDKNIYSDRYRYLNYLGEEALDLYTCRKATNFSLIGIPSVDDEVIRTKFIEKYNINNDYILRTVYSDAYIIESDYYNQFIILFILVNTIMDMVNSIPDVVISRDVFDSRCIKYLFESCGIPYYPEIPLKYQRAMLKNLNILIKYMASTRNMVDICSLFGFSDITVFGYYMMKSRLKDEFGNYIVEEDNNISYELKDIYVKDPEGSMIDILGQHYSPLSEYKYYIEDYYTKEVTIMNDNASTTTKRIINKDLPGLYVYDESLEQMIPLKESTYFTKIKANTVPSELKFIKVPIGDTLSEYKSEEDYINSYDEITLEETWDGGKSHDRLKEQIMDYAFNAVKSKYISVDNVTNLTDIAFQMSYFYNMLYDNAYNENNIKLAIDSIAAGHLFRLTDLIFFLFAMSYLYCGLEDKIMYSPTQILTVKGYSFTNAVNKAMADERHFSQTSDPMEQTNIFNINKEISERRLDYRDIFNSHNLKVKGFNLKADIDALETWLNKEWQMSLEDLVVSEDKEQWGQILTMRDFYTLNNSKYQKNIMSGNMSPLPFNNTIRYAYDILNKIYKQDVSNIDHTFIAESMVDVTSTDVYNFIPDIVALVSKERTTNWSYDELLSRVKMSKSMNELNSYAYILENIFAVNDQQALTDLLNLIKNDYYNLVIEQDDTDTIYVLNNRTYASLINSTGEHKVALYNKYTKVGTDYTKADKQYYYFLSASTNQFKLLISGYIYVQNTDGIFTFATDNIYIKSGDEYIEIDYNEYTHYDSISNARVLNIGDYFIKDKSGKWILDPEKCFVKVRIDNVWQFKPLKEYEDYQSATISPDDCYILRDGHYIVFSSTDFFDRTKQDSWTYNDMIYNELPMYVPVNYVTTNYDRTLPESERVYYKLLADYYAEDAIAVIKDELYVQDADGNFISENNLLNPNNTWFFDEITGTYQLVLECQYNYLQYTDPLNILYIMVLHSNREYYKYALDENENYKYIDLKDKKYMYNSDTKTIIRLDTSKTYNDSNSLITILNTTMNENITIDNSTEYNPSLYDNKWDENDWYYDGTEEQKSNGFNMVSENKWYYKNSDSGETSITQENLIFGSGFYIPKEEFIGSNSFIEDETYYIAFDVITNFSGTVQFTCSCDNHASSRNYVVTANELLHIDQTFIANDNTSPRINILKYNFALNPINYGDYVVIKNIKVVKAYSDNYIPNDIPNMDTLLKIYTTNTAIYKWLQTQMNHTSDKDTYEMYKTLYDSLMVSEYNKEIFKISDDRYALTYTEFLQSRDTKLYDILMELRTMDSDVMKKTIADYVIEIVYILNEHFNGYTLDQIYSSFPGVSANFIQMYILKIINWFKSWKVHLLGINTIYKLGNGINDGLSIGSDADDDFTVKILHDHKLHTNMNIYLKESFIKDTIAINPLDQISPDGTPYIEKYDFDKFTNAIDDRISLHDRVRIIVRYENTLEYDEKENKLHLHVYDPTTHANINDNQNLIISTINGDIVKVSDQNRLVINSDISPDKVYSQQMFDEINLLSGDHIEEDLDND